MTRTDTSQIARSPTKRQRQDAAPVLGEAPLRRSRGRPRGSRDKVPRKRRPRDQALPPPLGARLCSVQSAAAVTGEAISVFRERTLPRIQSLKMGRRRMIVVESLYTYVDELIRETAKKGELLGPRLKIAKSADKPAAQNNQTQPRKPGRPRAVHNEAGT